MIRIRLLSPYPLVTGADGRPAIPPLVVDAPPHVARQLVAAALAEVTEADVEGEVTFAGFGEPEAPEPEEPTGKRRKG